MVKLSILIPVWNQSVLVIKALNNIPRRDDIEILVRDDGSTDNTLANLYTYQYIHPELNLTISANGENKGVAWTKNRLLEESCGEYFTIHDSDDYVYTEAYNSLIDQLYDITEDILCFDLEGNDGRVFMIRQESIHSLCSQSARFMRRKIVMDNNIRWPEHIKAGDDWNFMEDLLRQKPTHKFTGVVAYHYNFPREGSLYNLQSRGLI